MLAERLRERQKTYISSTGALFREIKDIDTDVGRRVKETITRGGLATPVISLALWVQAIAWQVKEDEGILFEGSPRSMWEAEALDQFLDFLKRKEHTKVIYLVVGSEEVVQRLLARGREDDTEKAIRGRVAFFYERVMPVIEYYRAQGKLLEVNGDQSVEKVHEDVARALGI